MWWSRIQRLDSVEEREGHVMLCFPMSFPCFSQEQGDMGLQQPLINTYLTLWLVPELECKHGKVLLTLLHKGKSSTDSYWRRWSYTDCWEAEAELLGDKHLCTMSHPQLCLSVCGLKERSLHRTKRFTTESYSWDWCKKTHEEVKPEFYHLKSEAY